MNGAYLENNNPVINQYMNNPHINNGEMDTITNNLLIELNTFIENIKIRKYISVKIDMILFNTHPNPEQTDYTDEYINNLNNNFNEINQFVFQPIEYNFINLFMNLINRCNREQKKIVYNRMNSNNQNIPANINIII